jgi:hypothetical protein
MQESWKHPQSHYLTANLLIKSPVENQVTQEPRDFLGDQVMHVACVFFNDTS